MKRSLSVDCLRVLLALMVLGIHAGLPVVTTDQIAYLLRDGLFRIAVPIFFIMNGYYLVGALATRDTMRAWTLRLLAMYAFWMVVYLPFYWPDPISARSGAVFISLVVFGYFHLWYVAALLMGGWILFLLRERSWRFLLASAVLCFVAGVIVQYVTVNRGLRVPVWVYRGPLLDAFPMLAIGYLLKQAGNLRAYQGRALVALGAGLFLLLAEAWLMHPSNGGGFDLFLALLLVCPALFIVANNLTATVGSDHLAKLSSAIYFCHPLMIWVSRTYFDTGWGTSTSVLTLGLCLLAYVPLYLLSKQVKFIF